MTSHAGLDISSLIPFSTIISISIAVKISNFTLVFLKPCNANLGADKNFARSSSYILRHIFLKFSNTSANNNAFP